MYQLIHGSAHNIPIPDKSVHCLVTSPPYFGLRVYQDTHPIEWPTVEYAPMPGVAPIRVPAQTCDLGLENDIESYIGHLMLCLREWWRVLRDDGTCWVNLGDSMSSGKQEASVPERFKLAAQADGWICRSTIIWSKPNPMPESVTDRPTKAHEYVYLLAKAVRYYYDADAIREVSVHPAGSNRGGSLCRIGNDNFVAANNHKGEAWLSDGGRNKRTVWTANEPMYRLRSDLTPEQRAFVLQRIAAEDLR